MNSILTDIKQLLDKKEVETAFDMCRQAMKTGEFDSDSTFWFLYGKTLWAMDRRPQAEAAYRQSMAIDPNSPARIALEMSEDISSFFNPDLLNP